MTGRRHDEAAAIRRFHDSRFAGADRASSRVLSGRGWIARVDLATVTLLFKNAWAVKHLTVNDVEALAGDVRLIGEIHLLWKTEFAIAAKKSRGRPFRLQLRRTLSVHRADTIAEPWRVARRALARGNK